MNVGWSLRVLLLLIHVAGLETQPTYAKDLVYQYLVSARLQTFTLLI